MVPIRSLAALVAAALGVVTTQGTLSAAGRPHGLSSLKAAIALCLTTAPSPAQVTFSRYQAMQNCQEAEASLAALQVEANRARNQSCSSRLQAISATLLQVSMHGSNPALTDSVLSDTSQLRVACYHNIDPAR